MAFGKTAVWLDVTDDALEAAVVSRGAIAKTHRVESSQRWTDESLAQAIAQSIGELGVTNPRVDVLWRREDGSTAVVQTPVAGKPAPGAALLTMIESGGIEPAKQATEAHILAPTPEAGSHVLVSAVKQTRIDWIHQTIKDAGATPHRVFAGEAFAAATAINLANETSQTDPVACIVMGENVSAISITSDGVVKLVRFADIGISSLREAYAQALANAENAPDNTASLAQELLFGSTGIPAPREEIVPGVAATDILRVMQPALQRIAVELKQSIRFTVDAADRSRLLFRIGGLAGNIKHLDRLLAEQIEADDSQQTESPSKNPETWLELASTAGIASWDGVALGNCGTEGAGVSLRPFWSGVAAALLMLVGIGALAQSTTTKLTAQARTVNSELDGHKSSEVSAEDLHISRALDAATESVKANFATRADIGAALRLVADAASDAVGIEALSAQRSSENTIARLRAKASGTDAQDARNALQVFISTLDKSPIVQEVKVGSIRIIEEPADTYATFDATITLNETIAEWFSEEIAQ